MHATESIGIHFLSLKIRSDDLDESTRFGLERQMKARPSRKYGVAGVRWRPLCCHLRHRDHRGGGCTPER